MKNIKLQFNAKHALTIQQGDILESNAELIVTTVYAHGSSELFEQLSQRYGVQVEYEQKILPITGGGYISIVRQASISILCIRLSYTEDTKLAFEQFESIVEATFAAISTLLFEGQEFQQIALPVFGHTMLEQQTLSKIINSYLHCASSSLKYAKTPVNLTYYVLHASEFERWNRVIASITSYNTLQTFPKTLKSSQKDRVLVEAQKLYALHPIPSLKALIDSLQGAQVGSKTQQAFEKLTQFALRELYSIVLPSFKLNRPLVAPTRELLALNVLPGWYVNYFQYLKTLKQTQKPFQSLSNEEQVQYLLIMKRILDLLTLMQSGELERLYYDSKK